MCFIFKFLILSTSIFLLLDSSTASVHISNYSITNIVAVGRENYVCRNIQFSAGILFRFLKGQHRYKGVVVLYKDSEIPQNKPI